MAAGDLITSDGQYEVNGLLMGDATIHIDQAGVTGWDDVAVAASDTNRDLSPGASSGYDSEEARMVRVPLLIVADDEAAARAELRLVQTAWTAGGFTDVQLHRQVAGQREYLVGRTRGCAPVLTRGGLASGLIPVLCSFFANDPTIHEVLSS